MVGFGNQPLLPMRALANSYISSFTSSDLKFSVLLGMGIRFDFGKTIGLVHILWLSFLVCLDSLLSMMPLSVVFLCGRTTHSLGISTFLEISIINCGDVAILLKQLQSFHPSTCSSWIQIWQSFLRWVFLENPNSIQKSSFFSNSHLHLEIQDPNNWRCRCPVVALFADYVSLAGSRTDWWAPFSPLSSQIWFCPQSCFCLDSMEDVFMISYTTSVPK